MKRHERGLTLIEILLALIVMVLGIVGILALFPPALQSAKESMEMTQGAILSESVANAVESAGRYMTVDTSGSLPHYQLTINHDSINSLSGALVYYQFWLPNFADGMSSSGTGSTGTDWFHHPAPSPPTVGPKSTNVPEDEPDWRLAGDPWTKTQNDAIRGTSLTTGSDASDPLQQFAYSFDVRKINTLEYLMAAPPAGQSLAITTLESMVRVWEIRINTFRVSSTGGFQVGTGTSTAGSSIKKMIARVTTRLTVR